MFLRKFIGEKSPNMRGDARISRIDSPAVARLLIVFR
jgi:hypothetical protein